MIESLRIENLASIERAELCFTPGFTVITGETGAGKTMLLTSLEWLRGAKTDSKLVSAGAAQAVVEGSFLVDEFSAKVVSDAGGAVEDGLVEAVRIVPSSSRSRSHLGGRTVPATVLTDFALGLVSVHGQAAQGQFRGEKAQREALDSFGSLAHQQAVAEYKTCWEEWRSAKQEYEDWDASSTRREERSLILSVLLEQFEGLRPRSGEFDELASLITRLSNVETLRENVLTALNSLSSQTEQILGAVDQVAAASRALNKAVSEDESLDAVVQAVESVEYSLSDIVGELQSYLDELNADPQLLQESLSRRAALNDLGRKVNTDPNDLDSAWSETARELTQIQDGKEQVDKLVRRLDLAASSLERSAQSLHKHRVATAKSLAAAVNKELCGLDMKDTRISVAVNSQEVSSHGSDQIEFMLQPHPKAHVVPLSQAASGGELSRIMLAVEVCLADSFNSRVESERKVNTTGRLKNSAAYRHTYIFDEVDAGIGGQAGIEVGRRLRRLAKEYQVIVVTHLAQVAAFADTQIEVSKVAGVSQLSVLKPEQRREELARMISGNQVTKTALQHADELLARANVGQSET